MLVASLSLLIGMLLGGQNISAYIVEDLPKEIKANVDDKEKQKEILSITKAYEKEFKGVQKDLKKSKKQMKKLNLDRNTTPESINAVLDEADNSWKEVQTLGLKSRSAVLEMLSQEEWSGIISKSLEDYSKKDLKKQDKALEDFEKKFDKLKKDVAKEITDPKRQENIFATFDTFKVDMENYVAANRKRTIKDMGDFGNLEASEAELQQELSSLDEARSQFFEGIEKLHFELVENTTEEEWAKIAKSVNKIF